jgi:hypothetical protein
MSDRSPSPAPVDASALAQVIRRIIDEMRSERPRYKSHPLGYVDSVSASNVDEWADELEALLAAPRAPLEPREEELLAVLKAIQANRRSHENEEPCDTAACSRCHQEIGWPAHDFTTPVCEDCLINDAIARAEAARPRPALPQEPPPKCRFCRDDGTDCARCGAEGSK